MPETMPTCFGPAAVSSRLMISTGINACRARGSLPVSIFHCSFRSLTLSLVRVFSFLFQPVRWLSPPSVSQSTSCALAYDCALTTAACGRWPAFHASAQDARVAAIEMDLCITEPLPAQLSCVAHYERLLKIRVVRVVRGSYRSTG